MMTPEQIERILDRVLLRVDKPGRYVGGEYNSIAKDWQACDVRWALAFPDIYDLGMSNHGLVILYDRLNGQEDVLVERVYAPWVDMEAAMTATRIMATSDTRLKLMSNSCSTSTTPATVSITFANV